MELQKELGRTVKCDSPWQDTTCFKAWYKQIHTQYKGALQDQNVKPTRD